MVGPAAKREAVAHLRNVLQMSERRACSLVAADRKPDIMVTLKPSGCWDPGQHRSGRQRRGRIDSARICWNRAEVHDGWPANLRDPTRVHK
jgi:putative transposase